MNSTSAYNLFKSLLPCSCCLILLVFQVSVFAQSTEPESSGTKHKLSLALTHTLVPTAIDANGTKQWLSLASWGFDYDYELTERWGLGLHSDMVIQNFKYEYGDVIRERKNPISVAVVARRNLTSHLGVMAGGGAEFSSGEETLKLIRLGAEYGWELPQDWEIGFAVMYDIKIEAYNAFVMGFALGKKF